MIDDDDHDHDHDHHHDHDDDDDDDIFRYLTFYSSFFHPLSLSLSITIFISLRFSRLHFNAFL